MAYFGKTFKLSKVENLTKFQEESGQPVVSLEPLIGVLTVKLDKVSDTTYTFTSSFASFKDILPFELGKETAEKNRPDGIKFSSVFSFDGDVLKEVQKLSTGKTVIIIRKYSASGFESTMQVEGSSTVAVMNFSE